MKIRTILANPTWAIGAKRYGVRAGSRWPASLALEGRSGKRHYVPFPFFLAYAASLLKKHHKEALIIDAVAEGLNKVEFVERIKNNNPDIIVLETATPSFKVDIETAKELKQKFEGVRMVLTGPHASALAFEILTQYEYIDYILIGEYEHTLLDLINYMEGKTKIGNISGLAHRMGNKVKVNKQGPAINNFDSLSWPERESLPIQAYNDGFCDLPKPNVQVLASRGCPYKCKFCLWPQTIYNSRVYQKRTPEGVINEVAWLLDRYNFKAVYFDDDTFNIDRNYVLEICKEISKRKIRFLWAIMARADLMDKQLLERMKQAGLYAIKYGIESADEKILRLCNKDMDLNKTKQIIMLTKEIGIKVHLTFCLGLPGETNRSIEKTIKFIESVKPDSLQFSFATPFPGTDFFKYANENGLIVSDDWDRFDGTRRCVVRTEKLTNEDLERIMIRLRNQFQKAAL